MTVDITNIISAILTLIVAIAGVVISKTQKAEAQKNTVYKWISIAVAAAEQAYKTGLINGDERFKYAWDKIEGKLNSLGFSVDKDELTTFIESEVNKLPKTGTTKANAIVSESSLENGRGDN